MRKTQLCLLLVALFFTSTAWADIEALRQRESQIRASAAEVLPCTVCLRAGGGIGFASGSGVIVSPEGLILTAGHVSGEPGTELTVIFPDGSEATGVSLGANMNQDAGMVKITEGGPWPYALIGEDPTSGDWVFAMGHAGGFDPNRTPPLRIGQVHTTAMFMLGLISDCTLIGGDSGGPLFDLNGRVVGIHSSIGLGLSENRHVPISVFQEDWNRLLASESWGTLGQGQVNEDGPYLGVGLAHAEEGVQLTEVTADSPAAQAGLQSGDIVVQIGDQVIEHPQAMFEAVQQYEPGDTLSLEILREGDSMTIEVVAGRRGDYQ